MTAVYRIPLVLSASAVTWIEDIDLPLLLAHPNSSGSGAVQWLVAQFVKQNDSLRLQCLASPYPSAIPGERCSTLVLALESHRPISDAGRAANLYAVTGPELPNPKVVQAELASQLGHWDFGNAEESRRCLGRLEGILLAAKGAAAQADEVTIKETPDALEVRVSDKPFFTYRYNTKDPELPRPVFHPLIGPSGKPITQMGEVPDKKVAHFHHTALWIAHQNFAAKGMPNQDNWQIGRNNSSKIAHVKFDKIENGPLAARFIEKLSWLNIKGDAAMLEETRTVTVPKRPVSSRVLDIDIALKCGETPVTFNRTPYHLLACRVLDAMLPKNGGAMTNSDGKKNPPDGAPAAWIDISGKLDGEEQGVALFNHPKNDRQPTPCLQFSGQTIGLSPTHKEPLTIEAGKEVRFRYRVLVHAGNVEEGKVAGEYEAYGKGGMAKIGGVERISG